MERKSFTRCRTSLRPALRRKPTNLIVFYSVPKKSAPLNAGNIAQNANQGTTKRHINLVFLLSLYACYFIYSFFLFSLINYLCVCVCRAARLTAFSLIFVLSFVFSGTQQEQCPLFRWGISSKTDEHCSPLHLHLWYCSPLQFYYI